MYTRVYPSRAVELIQYNHIIHSAVQNFIWDNVYCYDKEFRIHLSNFPQLSWSVILQQAWSLYLKDRISHRSDGGGYSMISDHNKKGGSSSKSKKDICNCFNAGKCIAGFNCKYDHRCKYCGMFGHGEHICHKKLADKQNNSGQPKPRPQNSDSGQTSGQNR